MYLSPPNKLPISGPPPSLPALQARNVRLRTTPSLFHFRYSDNFPRFMFQRIRSLRIYIGPPNTPFHNFVVFCSPSPSKACLFRDSIRPLSTLRWNQILLPAIFTKRQYPNTVSYHLDSCRDSKRLFRYQMIAFIMIPHSSNCTHRIRPLRPAHRSFT
ncbi:hypothetical protein EDD15DRAFT_2245755 [Pisolithus albus]|nr:hypothetical protein EDD15DRAFT_2245755 [Pisolithus albus]